jgi:chromosome segregation ATPase
MAREFEKNTQRMDKFMVTAEEIVSKSEELKTAALDILATSQTLNTAMDTVVRVVGETEGQVTNLQTQIEALKAQVAAGNPDFSDVDRTLTASLEALAQAKAELTQAQTDVATASSSSPDAGTDTGTGVDVGSGSAVS